VSASLAVLSLPHPQDDGTEDLWKYLEQAFLDEAGWDLGTETLAPRPGHPLLGYRLCLVRAAPARGRPTEPGQAGARCHLRVRHWRGLACGASDWLARCLGYLAAWR
jgi:hypothetical protein